MALGDLIYSWLNVRFGNPYLAVFFLSLFPMIEVRGAIPVGVGMGMELWAAALLSALSALLVCPVVYFGLRPLLKKLKTTSFFRKFAAFLEERFRTKAGEIDERALGKREKKGVLIKTLGVYAFVALPLPLTGVWTGSAVAAFLDLKPRYALPALVTGNFTAAGLVALFSFLLGDKAYLILFILAAFIALSLILLLFGALKPRKKGNRTQPPLIGDDEEKTPD